MTLVVDASVAVKWFIDEVGSDEARALLTSAEHLAAVERTSGRLVTADERFVRKLQATSWGPAVGLLGSAA